MGIPGKEKVGDKMGENSISRVQNIDLHKKAAQ